MCHDVDNDSGHGHIEPNGKRDSRDFPVFGQMARPTPIQCDERQGDDDRGQHNMGQQNHQIEGSKVPLVDCWIGFEPMVNDVGDQERSRGSKCG